jgi:hypothetical protein
MGNDNRQAQISLADAAALAYRQLVPGRPIRFYDSTHLGDILCLVARALAKTAPLYVTEGGAPPRAMTGSELQGASITLGATRFTLRDGREFTRVTMRRAELWQAIAVLRSAGLQPHQPEAPKPRRFSEAP